MAEAEKRAAKSRGTIMDEYLNIERYTGTILQYGKRIRCGIGAPVVHNR